MSFTSDTKKELTLAEPDKKCCMLAEVAGFLRFSGSISITGGKLGIRVVTDNAAVARLFITLIKRYFGAKTALSVGDPKPLSKGRSYELYINPDMNAEQILREVGILGVKEGSNYITDGIDPDIVKRRCCKKAMLRGIFLGAGSISDPAKSYHMELLCTSEYMAGDVRKLISSLGLRAKVSRRKNKFLVYIKEGEQIADFLNIVGATNQYFKYQDKLITKELMNKTNRISNCETANLDKVINAAQRQLADIEVIEKTRGLSSLPERLRVTAMLRMEHPELSLGDLAELFDPPLKKSGLNHRLDRLAELADKLRQYKSEHEGGYYED